MSDMSTTATLPVRIAIAWALVGIPLAYGVYNTLLEAAALFTA
jgi:hypothetical protein